MADVIAAVDSTTGAFGPLVQNRLHTDMQTAINAGVATAMSATPAFVSAVGSITADGLVAPLVSGTSATRTALDSRYRAPLLRQVFDVKDYGAIGDGVADDTAAVQAAVNAALAASDPINVEKPIYNGQSPTVFFPLGSYSINTVTVAGTINFLGVGGAIYAASVIAQRTAGQSVIVLSADTDATSNATVFEKMTFKSSTGSSNPAVAQVKTSTGIGSNSVYFRSCWFKTPECYAIWVTQGDDIQITDCTFDVSAFHAIRLGSASGQVTNATINNNTFYNIAIRCIEPTNVFGLTVTANRVYNSASCTFIDQNGASVGGGWAVSGNSAQNISSFANLYGGQVFAFTGNSLYMVNTVPFQFQGGQIIYAVTITGNTIISSGALTHGAFYANATGVQVSNIQSNSVIAGASSVRLFDMADNHVSGNRFNNNASLRFQNNDNFLNPSSNGVS